MLGQANRRIRQLTEPGSLSKIWEALFHIGNRLILLWAVIDAPFSSKEKGSG